MASSTARIGAAPSPHKQLPEHGWPGKCRPCGPSVPVSASHTVTTTCVPGLAGEILTTKCAHGHVMREPVLLDPVFPCPLGPADPQTASPLTQHAGGRMVVELTMRMLDVQSLGRLASTCRLFARLSWPVVQPPRRSRNRPAWESTPPHIFFSKSPIVVVLPGNPDIRAPFPQALMAAISRLETLRVLSLRLCKCGDIGVTAIAAALPSTLQTLEFLDLRFNALTDKSVGPLMEAAIRAPRLRELLLAGNPLGDLGGQAIALALEADCGLQRLDISTTRLTDRIGEALGRALRSNTHLRELDVSGNELGCTFAFALETALPASAVRVLLAARNPLGPYAASLAKALECLERLDLAATNLLGIGVRALLDAGKAPAARLRILEVSGNRLGPSSCTRVMAAIADTRIATLDLSRNACDPDAAVAMATHVAAAGAAGLRKLIMAGEGGDHAHAGGGEIRSMGAIALFNALRAHPGCRLAELVLAHQGIRDDAAPAIAEWIASGTCLLLSLQANKLGARGAAMLLHAAAGAPRLVEINLSQNCLRGLAVQPVSTTRTPSGIVRLALQGCSLPVETLASLAALASSWLLRADLAGNAVDAQGRVRGAWPATVDVRL
eukprot:m.66599 g.66599  ORF g.66599 m.66599 type:complete len:611 (-) comp7415_c0_seq1:142-1974(-)